MQEGRNRPFTIDAGRMQDPSDWEVGGMNGIVAEATLGPRLLRLRRRGLWTVIVAEHPVDE